MINILMALSTIYILCHFWICFSSLMSSLILGHIFSFLYVPGHFIWMLAIENFIFLISEFFFFVFLKYFCALFSDAVKLLGNSLILFGLALDLLKVGAKLHLL